MKLLINIFLLFTGISVGFSQSSVKGYKYFDKLEFEKSKETFYKHLKDDSTSSVCYFGLALMYENEKNPDHDFFKAWDAYQSANKYFSKITPEETEFLKQFFTESDPRKRGKTIRFNYDTEGKVIEDKLIKFVREENNVEVAEHFLMVYPGSKYYENVVHIRNHIKFRLAEKENTIEAYRTFIKNYPDAAQVPKATNACYALSFELAKKENTIASYSYFIQEFPQADQYFEALRLRDQLAFEDAKKKNTIESMSHFIETYPKALQIMTARTILRKLLYDKAKEVNTLEAYNDFISKYPDGEYFVDIFNLKSNVLGKKMSEQFEGAKEAIQWIKGFDFDQKNDQAGGVVVTSDGKTILAGNRQKSDEPGEQSWLICVDNAGKVLWNKAFGSKTFNHSNQLSLLATGEMVISGWSGASSDSINRRAWMFKVNQNGGGIWEKNVEGNEIKDLTFSQDGSLYLSGYNYDDSLRIKTFLLKLNSDLHKLWSRQYVKKGILNGVAVNAKGDLTCGSGRWVWKMDKQGYVLWEKLLPAGDSIQKTILVNNQTWLGGSRNTKPLFLKYAEQTNTTGEFPALSSKEGQVIGVYALPNKRFLTLIKSIHSLLLSVIDEKGVEIKSINIPQARVTGSGAIFCGSAGEVYLTFTSLNEQNQEDIGVAKFNF